LSESVTIRIGLQSVREIEIEVEDSEAAIAEIEAAMTSDAAFAWVEDIKGTRHGLSVDKLAFVQVDAKDPKMVGFSGTQ